MAPSLVCSLGTLWLTAGSALMPAGDGQGTTHAFK
jgi:hypothetical protein